MLVLVVPAAVMLVLVFRVLLLNAIIDGDLFIATIMVVELGIVGPSIELELQVVRIFFTI